MRKMKILAWASVSHFFIDFLCAWLITHQLIENGPWFFLLFLYNFLAFAAQLPLGILLDALSTRRMTDRAGAVGSLYELYRRLPRNPGAAFGLLTFALYLGFLPVYTGMAEGLRHPLYYSVFALISLFLLAYALRKTAGKEEEEGGL